ncbi:hypothetical protein LOTGIDRAFT_158324 [Lottia gigantea]|uniref:EGF-like domain-containing protein n=1 Tax=Lottia gigantea TaxID=225164 RepID=V4A7Z5_LOTGI|nr:hypothetical protein LOTGIDRAFT_158324 [Lottia gigantea]ESP00094.1 hypothetical protein LOTGIDRAFT_158324 [Lottia gigantea]
MAVDWITRNLYWSDSGLKQIMVSREDGRYPHRLFYDGVDEPRSIAVHPVKRFLFWCDAGVERPGIERSYLDGSNRTIIVARNRVQRPRALAIDFKDDRLYWTDGMVIHYGKLDGTGQFCLHSSGRSTVRSLLVLQLYTVTNIFTMSSYHEFRLIHQLQSPRQKEFLSMPLIGFNLYRTVQSNRCSYKLPLYKNNGYCSQDACGIKNGDCEHLCLPSATGRTCACSLGYWKINETRCISGVGDEKFLLFADQRQGAIFQRPLFLNEYYAIPLQGVKQPRDVVYDPVKKFFSAPCDTFFFISAPYTLTLDAKSQLLYFVDIYKDLVVAVNLRNKQYAKIIEGDRFVAFQNIKNVALDPTRGMMYISCQHKMISDNKTRLIGAIYSATMTGKNLTAFHIGPGEPKGLVVYEDEVIWIDSQKRYIKGKATVNGSVYDLKRITESGQLHDITISDGYIYWTVLSGKPIKRSPLDNLTETETLGWDNFYRVQSIDSYTGDTLNEFCLTRGVNNGTLVNNGRSRYVPVGYRLEILCNPGYKIKGKMTAEDNRRGYVLCIGEGSWNKRAVCEFALLYEIHGTNNRGYVELTRSTYFLVPPRVKRLNVICIGGGGGGFDSNYKEFKKKDKAGDGQASSFSDKLISLGGEGGRLWRGGNGGIGTVLFGGEGASANDCHYGGAAGQLTQKKGCYQPSTFCLYCGAGGSRGKGECPLCPLGLEGGCSGPLSSNATKHAGCSYGGGSSGGSGGGGGGAGYSRAYVDVTPGEMVLVTVGKGGAPSYKPAGDGIVVISWNGRIEDFKTDRIMMYEESNFEDKSCL